MNTTVQIMDMKGLKHGEQQPILDSMQLAEGGGGGGGGVAAGGKKKKTFWKMVGADQMAQLGARIGGGGHN